MRRRSLTRVLAGGVLLANLVCSATFSVVAVLHELHGRRRAFDVMLQGRADSVRGLATHPSSTPSRTTASAGHFFVVLGPTGDVLARSAADSPSVQSLLTHPVNRGYFDCTWNGGDYRVLRLHYDAQTMPPATPATVIYGASIEDLHHEAVEAAIYYSKVALSLLAAITVLLLWFLRSRLAPLHELAVSAGRVSANAWQLEVPPAALQTQELRPIALSMQELLHRLRLAFERQQQFTGDAAHELKTSIAVLKTRSQLLSMRQRRVEEYERGAAELLADIQRMEGLVTGMLTLARIEGAAALPMQGVDLGVAVKTIAEYLKPMAVAEGITIQLQVDDLCHVRVPEKDAEILCSNLILNALQHGPKQSTVTASVVKKQSAVELRVTDCGEGIPLASQQDIFERFFRVDASRTRATGGAGLGLAICKAIANRAGASIAVSSEPGRGTEICVSFPSAAAAVQPLLSSSLHDGVGSGR